MAGQIARPCSRLSLRTSRGAGAHHARIRSSAHTRAQVPPARAREYRQPVDKRYWRDVAHLRAGASSTIGGCLLGVAVAVPR